MNFFLLTTEPVLIMLDEPLQVGGCFVDGSEEVELGVELGVGGHNVLVLILAELAHHSLNAKLGKC